MQNVYLPDPVKDLLIQNHLYWDMRIIQSILECCFSARPDDDSLHDPLLFLSLYDSYH